MAEYNTEPKKSGNSAKVITTAVIALLVIIAGVVWYMDNQEDKKREDLITAQQTQIDDARTQLNDMEAQLNQRIAEIEQLGGNVEELERAKAALEEEKKRLERSNNVTASQLRDVRAKVSGYETLLKEKDLEITRLRSLSDSLYAENTTLKTTQNQMTDSIRALDQNRQKLTEKVAIASRLKAENIKVFGVNKRGKEREGEFRDGQIEELKVQFNLAKNDVAPIESKNIMMRVIDPNGNVLFDVATGSGTMMIEGREEFYTANQELLFDNTRQQVTFVYNKESDYEDGTYVVELYSEDYKIGERKFTVK
jgi:cell division protein ZapB